MASKGCYEPRHYVPLTNAHVTSFCCARSSSSGFTSSAKVVSIDRLAHDNIIERPRTHSRVLGRSFTPFNLKVGLTSGENKLHGISAARLCQQQHRGYKWPQLFQLCPRTRCFGNRRNAKRPAARSLVSWRTRGVPVEVRPRECEYP
jgi:hypothetical protein